MDAKTLWNLLESAGLEPTTYSGRGMYGRYCVSVKGADDAFEIIADIVSQAVRDGQDVLDVCDVIRSTRTDALGMGVVIYWPRMKLDGEALATAQAKRNATTDEAADDEQCG